MNRWVTADLHLGHTNLCTGTTTWDRTLNRGSIRDFSGPDAMTDHILNNINKCVMPEDEFFILGDLSFPQGQINVAKKYLDRINCKNIIFIVGNHDKWMLDKNGNLDITIAMEMITDGYFKGVHTRFEKKVGGKKTGQRAIFDHFAARTWNKAHRGSFQLHGHSHSSLEQPNNQWDVNKFYNKYRTMDVGIDNAFRILGEYRPFHWAEILDRLNNRPTLGVDHHTQENGNL